MIISNRPYDIIQDYFRVSGFLSNNFSGEDEYSNWLQPRWEYVHYHTYFDCNLSYKIRLWEENGQIVAVTNFESKPGKAYFHMKKSYEHLKEEMLLYAMDNMYGENENIKSLIIFFNSSDKEFIKLAQKHKFNKERSEWIQIYPNDKEIPKVKLPEGYSIKSLADEDNPQKLHDVFFRGFDHGTPDKITKDELIQHEIFAPNFDFNLNIFIDTPNNEYASYSGIWYDRHNKVGYIEPVCTDPKYRRMGFGKAAVLKCVHRCRALGATRIYVESSQQFYLSIGFQKSFSRDIWKREY